MELTYINKKATYYHYEITVVINEKVVDYDVHIAATNDKKWIQNYGKKHIVKLTTSERKQIKKYIENDFIGVLANDKTSESGLDLQNVSNSVCAHEFIPKKCWVHKCFKCGELHVEYKEAK